MKNMDSEDKVILILGLAILGLIAIGIISGAVIEIMECAV